MQIDIQACNFSLTDALRSHAERRLPFTSLPHLLGFMGSED